MKTQPTHTPTPWKYTEDRSRIWGPYNEHIATMNVGNGRRISSTEKGANAAFIVRAVNAHDELLKHLKRALSYLEDFNEDGEPAGIMPKYERRAIEQAIAKAEGANDVAEESI